MTTEPLRPTPDQCAAHDLLSELRTRIATQPLPYQYGVEARALESLWELFGLARKAMKDNPGCAEFARATTTMLNVDLRPITAKWHRAHREGLLDSKDGANAFRADLARVRARLLGFAGTLHEMAYGAPLDDVETPAVLREEDVEGCFRPLRFGMRRNDAVRIDNIEAINEAEREEIAARRARLAVAPVDGCDAVGLALSGGGIRSATFCLGVVQVLAERGLMPHVDYLSTVSGGGYTGSFVTSVVGGGGGFADVGRPYGPDTAWVGHLRRNAKYLNAVDLKQRWLMVTGTLAGLLLNWTAPLFALSAVALLRVLLGPGIPDDIWLGIGAVLGVLTVAAVLGYGVTLRFGAATRIGSHAFAWGVGSSLSALAIFVIERGYSIFSQAVDGGWGASGPALAAAAGAVAAAPALVRFLPIFGTPAFQRRVLVVALWLAGLSVPLLAVVGYYALRRLGSAGPDPSAASWSPLRHVSGEVVLGSIVAVSGAFVWLVLDVNLTGPHRIYRDGLARTFLKGGAGAGEALGDVNPGAVAPYHLINATLNLPSSTSEVLRDRRGDFFLFSKRWCGAPSIGYRETGAWAVGRSGIDLATAMAVSGAAASPQMGLGSVPSLSALLTLLNIRLGIWIRRPGAPPLPSATTAQRGGSPRAPRPIPARWRAPGFTCLLREMTGTGMSEDGEWLNVSDGGHIENMGVYELLRRRCKYIVCVDGEADPKSMFEGQLTLVRHAQIDFGIVIEPRLDEIRPDERSRFSRTHAQLFRILYNDSDGGSEIGLMLYLKLSLTGDEAELLKRYRAIHPDFPHQSTLDQFYGEEQFEAYRQLGVHVAEGMFSPALMTTDPDPRTVAVWFRQLAANMLEPLAHPRTRPAADP